MDRKPNPHDAEVRSGIELLLADLDRNQLVQVLLTLAGDDPALASRIVGQIKRLKAATASARPGELMASPPRLEIPVDVKKIRREVRSVLHDSYGSSYSSWEPQGVPHLGQFLNQVWTLIQASQGNRALDVLEVITAEVAEDIDSLADEGGNTEDFLEHELAPAWTEAVLTANLTPQQREDWASKLDSWASEFDNYGYEAVFRAVSGALAQGWTDAALQHALSGKEREWGAWAAQQPPDLDQGLITARLNVLERQGRSGEALNLARAAAQGARYTALLLRLGRVGEAVEAAIEHFTTADEACALAKELRDKGEAEPALRIAEHGLTLAGYKGQLASFLADYAATLGRGDLALLAAIVAFKEQKDLATYQRVQMLAGPRWSEHREELLTHLRRDQSFSTSGAVDVFLQEHLIDDAIAAVERAGGYDTMEQVARAATETRPEWAVKTCRRQAEQIMDAGKAQAYHHAIDWLTIARDAYKKLGQSTEWKQYLEDLIAQHARKYKLRPMLEDLR